MDDRRQSHLIGSLRDSFTLDPHAFVDGHFAAFDSLHAARVVRAVSARPGQNCGKGMPRRVDLSPRFFTVSRQARSTRRAHNPTRVRRASAVAWGGGDGAAAPCPVNGGGTNATAAVTSSFPPPPGRRVARSRV